MGLNMNTKPHIQWHGHRKQWACMTIHDTGFGDDLASAYKSWSYLYTSRCFREAIENTQRKISFIPEQAVIDIRSIKDLPYH